MVIEMEERKKENLKKILRYFPSRLSEALENLDDWSIAHLYEINIRSSLPVVLSVNNRRGFLTQSGRFTNFYTSGLLTLDENEVKQVFERMCQYSVYAQTNNIINGFITIENGCRVGVYGTAVNEENSIVSVRNISGLNVRIASEYSGISESICNMFASEKNNVLICGPPTSGKTTLLKDLCKNLSDCYGYKLSVIDERSEFKDYYMGFNTDVLCGYPKAEGAMIALRTLSPEIIVFDELGSVTEVETVLQGVNSGVAFVMSIHCRNKNEAFMKKQVKRLLDFKAVDYLAFLKNKAEVEEIVSLKEIGDADNSTGCACNFLCACRSVHSLCSENKSAIT